MQLVFFVLVMFSLYAVFVNFGFWAGIAWALIGLPLTGFILNLLLGGVLFGAAKIMEATTATDKTQDKDKAA
jgi:hypothetical protein